MTSNGGFMGLGIVCVGLSVGLVGFLGVSVGGTMMRWLLVA